MVATYTCHYLESNKPAQLSHDVFGHKKALFGSLTPVEGLIKTNEAKTCSSPWEIFLMDHLQQRKDTWTMGIGQSAYVMMRSKF